MSNEREQTQQQTIADTPVERVTRKQQQQRQQEQQGQKKRLLPVSKDMQPGQLPEGRLIWDYERFPHRTNAYKITPQDVKNAIDEYASTLKDWQSIMAEKGISHATWFGSADQVGIVALYPEIRTAHALAARQKAEVYDQAAKGQWEIEPGDLPPELLCIDKADPEGKRLTLTAAGVQYLYRKSEFYARQALQHETGTRVPKQQIDSRQVSIHADLSAQRRGTTQTRELPSDLSEREPGEIVDWIFGGSGSKRLPGA